VDTEKWVLEQQCRSHEHKDGWWAVSSNEEILVLYAMCQLYNRNAGQEEPLFDMPDQQDRAQIYWHQGTPAAFYTVKPKG